MRSIQIVWNHLLRRPGVAVLLAMLVGAGIGRADRFPPDPVEELRLTLKAPGPGPNLMARVQALRTLADMRRALALQEWRSDTDIREELGGKERQEARLLLVERFKKEVRQVLRQGNADARLAVMTMLAEMGPTIRAPEDLQGIARTFAPDLAEVIKSGDTPRARETAARTLGQIFPDPGVAIPALRDLLSTGNVEERRAAASGLAGVMRTASQLISRAGTAAQQATADDIIQAVREVVPLAGRGLSDPDLEVRRSSAEAVLQAAAALNSQAPQSRGTEEGFENPADRALIEKTRTALVSAMDAFKEQMPALGQALNDPNLEVRLSIQRALEELGSARLRLLHGPLPNLPPAEVPAPAAPKGAALDRSRLTPVVLELQPAAPSDPLLEKLRELVPLLQAQLRDPNVNVRLGAIEVLETFGNVAAPAATGLIQALCDPDRFVRWAAARTLGKLAPIEPAATVPALARLLFDNDMDVRLSAATALDRFGPAAEAAVPDLILAMKSTDAYVREAAIRTLGGIGTGAQAAIPALAAALSDTESGIRPYVAGPQVRQIAAEVLGRFGPLADSAVPALRRLLDDPDPEVRKAASDALLNILQASGGL